MGVKEPFNRRYQARNCHGERPSHLWRAPLSVIPSVAEESKAAALRIRVR